MFCQAIKMLIKFLQIKSHSFKNATELQILKDLAKLKDIAKLQRAILKEFLTKLYKAKKNYKLFRGQCRI